jgi:hypothetical protein
VLHSGGVGEEDMEDQWGVPEREMDVTVQPRWAAALQMRLPRGGLAGVLCWARVMLSLR